MKKLFFFSLLLLTQACTTEIVHSDGSVSAMPVFEKKPGYSVQNACQNGAHYYIYTDENGKKGKVGPLENNGLCEPGETSIKD